jgi:hypothetical protein
VRLPQTAAPTGPPYTEYRARHVGLQADRQIDVERDHSIAACADLLYVNASVPSENDLWHPDCRIL